LAVGAAVCTLHVVHTIGVDDDLYAYLQSQAAGPAETMSQTLHRRLHLDPGGGGGSGPDGTTTVTFHILAGTGSAPWNTRETAVVGHVGDTLHVVNDDTQAHQLHTPGTPFPHPSAAIPPGQSADYVLRTELPAGGAFPPVYDHEHGNQAGFWITVLPTA